MIKNRKLYFVVGGLAILTGCTGIPEGLKPITDFDSDRYLGKWYEIARLDHPFERGLSHVTATYSKGADGAIVVDNKGFDSKTGTWKEVKGKARFIESSRIGSLKVSFFGPFYGGYHIIALDKENYAYSMVAGPSRSYLWILSRTPSMDETVYASLLKLAEEWGFDTSALIRVSHNALASTGER